MKDRLTKWRLLSVFAVLALVLSGCGEPFLSTLKPAGEVAKQQYDLMILSTIIMIGVIVVVTVIFVLAITRFRRKKVTKTKFLSKWKEVICLKSFGQLFLLSFC